MENILRLKVEGTQYNNTIKSAAEGIQHLAQYMRNLDSFLEDVDEKELRFIRSLGEMKTASKTAGGSLKELESAFKNLSATYNGFDEKWKNSAGAKALSQQLDILKQRIDEGRAAMSQANEELNGSSGLSNALENLASKFGLNIKQLAGWGAGIAAVTGASKVAKDAFFQMESNVDEWGRTVQSAQSIYEGFLNALNTGDISGYLTNIDNIIKAARNAYNAIDELRTNTTIRNPERAKLQAELTKQKAIIRREGADSEAGKAAQAQMRALEKRLIEVRKQEGRDNYNVFQELVKERLAEGNINLNKKSFDLLMRSFSDTGTYELLKRFAQGQIEKENIYDDLTGQVVGTRSIDKRNTNKKLLDLFTDEWRLTNSPYLTAYYNSQNAEASTLLSDARYLRTRRSSGGGGKSKSEQAQEKINQAQKDYNQSLEQAALELKAGTITQIAAKKKELSAEENLWKAIGDAREIYDMPGLKEKQQEVADKVVKLGGSITALEAEQKKAQDAARELAQAQKKLTDALTEASTAYNANDLKGYLAAMNKVGGDVIPGLASGNFTLTSDNLAAFKGYLKTKMGATESGSEQYKNLWAQSVDVNTLSTLISEATKRGVDLAEIAPQDFWSKIFGPTPGDYIDDKTWQSLADKIASLSDKKPIKLNFATGELEGKSTSNGKGDFNKLVGNVSTITGALNQLGVEIPEGFSKTLGVLQVISTITMAIQSLVGLTASTSILKSIPIIGWFFGSNGGVVHAANGFSGEVPGNMFSGDNIPAMLNSGETVLTRSQVGILSSALNAQTYSGTGRSEAVIESDQIRLVLQNGAQAKGMTLGEYLNI